MATIFTKIINGEIPSYKIAEDEEHFAFLDINPTAEGHTLVVPKKEIDYFFDLSDEEMHRLMSFAKKVAGALDEALDPLRTGVIIEGLEVPHAHVHLIPVYKTHQVMALSHTIEVSEERMKELARQVSQKVEL